MGFRSEAIRTRFVPASFELVESSCFKSSQFATFGLTLTQALMQVHDPIEDYHALALNSSLPALPGRYRHSRADQYRQDSSRH